MRQSLRDSSLEAGLGLPWRSSGFQGRRGLVRAVSPRVFLGCLFHCLRFSEKLPGILLEGGRDTALTLSASAPLQEGLGTSFAPRQSRHIFDVIGGAVRTFWVTAIPRSAFRVYFHSELLVYFLEKLLSD